MIYSKLCVICQKIRFFKELTRRQNFKKLKSNKVIKSEVRNVEIVDTHNLTC